MTSLLLTGGVIHSTADPFADAVLIHDGQIAWIGQSAAARVHHDSVDQVVNLRGALVTPAFVDAHVHATSAGLTLIGLDLSVAKTRAEALDLISKECRVLRGAPMMGHGWDESQWPDQTMITRAELDRATHGSFVYLSRRDVHSALVSSAVVAAVPEIASAEGFHESLPVTAAAHGLARRVALDVVAAHRRQEAQLAFLDHCLRRGISSVHECAGPVVSSEADLRSLQNLASSRGMALTSYWGEIGAEGIARAMELGARPGGDLFVDGSLGSHTAWLAEPYADHDSTGNCYVSSEEVEDHLRNATQAGVQAGFHAIGDRAIASITTAARRVADEDPSRFRSLGHRIEHVEMADEDDVRTMVDLSMVASVQPTFDWLWGGKSGMYAQRLGQERAHTLNRFGSWNRSGLALAFGSDAPVTPAEPWEWIRAALFHSNADEAITARAAFSAATRGGWRAAGLQGGVIAPGIQAHLAIWDCEAIVVQTPDSRVAAWSTDQRSGTPGLPEITLTGGLPRCLATISGVRVLHSEIEGLECL